MRGPGLHHGLPIVTVLALWTATFSLSCWRDIVGDSTAPPGGRRAAGAMDAMLGAGRSAVGGGMFDLADLYFHRGVQRSAPASSRDWALQRLARQISPEGRAHREGGDVREIMPWLWLAVRARPDHVDTYLVASFWLATAIGRRDLAIQLLTEAQQNIRCAYEIQLEKGRLYLRERRLAEAKSAFDAGLAFWPGDRDPRERDARLDQARLLLYRALLHETDGELAKAAANLRAIVTLFPDRSYLLDRAAELESGRSSALAASDYWQRLLDGEDRQRGDHPCDRDDHGTPHDRETHAPKSGK
jgi:tetratricopeptide (TPR) repeat protein